MTQVMITGSLTIGPYKGYHGKAEFDAETSAFHGVVTDTRDVITFVGDSPKDLEIAFRESIEDYLAFCKECGTAPEKPFSGNFMVRTTPKLHRHLSNRAAQHGVSLNQFVVQLLDSRSTAPLPEITFAPQVYEGGIAMPFTTRGSTEASELTADFFQERTGGREARLAYQSTLQAKNVRQITNG